MDCLRVLALLRKVVMEIEALRLQLEHVKEIQRQYLELFSDGINLRLKSVMEEVEREIKRIEEELKRIEEERESRP